MKQTLYIYTNRRTKKRVEIEAVKQDVSVSRLIHEWLKILLLDPPKINKKLINTTEDDFNDLDQVQESKEG